MIMLDEGGIKIKNSPRNYRSFTFDFFGSTDARRPVFSFSKHSLAEEPHSYYEFCRRGSLDFSF